ncbi:MAG: GAF domain-containing sensor histidine kinase [Acidobacteriota bacterium]
MKTIVLLRRVKWVLLFALVAFLAIVEYARYLLEPYGGSPWKNLVLDGVMVLSILFFFGALFTGLQTIEERLTRQNRELLGLHRAAVDIQGDLSLESVLQKVVDQACSLVDARYGAISVVDRDGRIRSFVTAGLSQEEIARIGEPPRGRGLLGVPLREGQRIRVRNLTDDPRSAGFPEHHPEMSSLLAVPILCKGHDRGNLYVTEKEAGAEFSAEDEETLVRFATTAAIAIDNARLHQRLRDLAVAEERVRIAREMHDGLAQVLAYVNAKAQAVREFLNKGNREQARAQLDQLADAAREVLTDVREGILALRTQTGPDRGLGETVDAFMRRWEDQSGIVGEIDYDADLRLSPTVELQLLRIVQEALSNVRKHSGAQRARVQLKCVDSKLLVDVRDDGSGFDPEAIRQGDAPRFGLAIMRERTVSIGGTIGFDSAPGRGTRVHVEVPLVEQQSQQLQEI